MVKGIVLIIPAYNPDEKFVFFLDKLTADGWKDIIVVDDGSKQECQHYFKEAADKYGCQLIRHNVNLGQGRAFKSAFNYFIGKYRGADVVGVVECDCDGQHIVEDVNRCAELLRDNPDKFILGVRNFSDNSIPFRSRFGNKCTSFVFKAFCGIDIKDTQTGLKGIPTSFIPALMEIPGERFEYASSVLLETKNRGIEILQFPIETIYINGNETSHFNPLLDSLRVYSLILKYLMASISSFIIDIVAYSIFIILFRDISTAYYIVIATYLAKIFSCTYSYMVNKQLVFESKGAPVITAIKFFSLCGIQATCSGFITRGVVSMTCWNEVGCKIIVDIVLFFVSFQIQNRWVFASSKPRI